LLRKPIYCNCGCIFSYRLFIYCIRSLIYVLHFFIYCFRSYIYLIQFYIYALHFLIYCLRIFIYLKRFYIYSLRIFIYSYRIYISDNRQKKKKQHKIITTEIQLNEQKGDRLTAVCRNGGFWHFLERYLLNRKFVYICNGLVLEVCHFCKLQNDGQNPLRSFCPSSPRYTGDELQSLRWTVAHHPFC